jgi:hypothetical protein
MYNSTVALRGIYFALPDEEQLLSTAAKTIHSSWHFSKSPMRAAGNGNILL